MKRILSLALLITMTISLCACNDERVVYPVEVVKPEKTLEEDTETKDSEAAEEKTEEKADNESDVDVPSEEFVLLEDDEEEEGPDESGTIVTHDGKPVIDLIFFMGQSNMSGAGGDKELAPPVTEGHGYEFRAISDPTRLYNIEEPFGKNESFIGGICDIPGAKKGSIVSCFANEYYALTGVPIVGVSASQGATTTEIWQSAGFQIDMQQRYDITVNWLNDNGYYIRNRYVVWFQGE